MPVTPIAEAEALSVSLGGLPVLRDISATIHRGELVALVGANGSGKTTFLRALLGLIPHQHGTIRLFGSPLAQFRDWDQIGYVPQASTLSLAKATVGEVVSMGRLAHRRLFWPPSTTDRRQIRQALEAVEMTDHRKRQFRHLSGGQQQRVLIARALASQAEFFILDEPLAGVDLVAQEALAKVVSELKAAQKTCLTVLHETGPFEPLIDRRITLYDGRLLPGAC